MSNLPTLIPNVDLLSLETEELASYLLGRQSQFFYWDDVPGCRLRPGRLAAKRRSNRPEPSPVPNAIGADMARKPLDLPMEVVKQFAEDMRAYHAEPNSMKRFEIAEHQLDVLHGFQGSQDKKLHLSDIIELFEDMKDLR